MRKFLTRSAVAVALVAIGAVSNISTASAQVDAQGAAGTGSSCTACASAMPAVIGAMWLYGVIVGPVVKDIMAGGLNRNYAEVVPGNGYQTRDYANAAKLTHEFNVAMGYSDDADTTKYLASAAR